MPATPAPRSEELQRCLERCKRGDAAARKRAFSRPAVFLLLLAAAGIVVLSLSYLLSDEVGVVFLTSWVVMVGSMVAWGIVASRLYRVHIRDVVEELETPGIPCAWCGRNMLPASIDTLVDVLRWLKVVLAEMKCPWCRKPIDE